MFKKGRIYKVNLNDCFKMKIQIIEENEEYVKAFFIKVFGTGNVIQSKKGDVIELKKSICKFTLQKPLPDFNEDDMYKSKNQNG